MIEKRRRKKRECFIKDILIFSNTPLLVISLMCNLTPWWMWRIASAAPGRAITKAHKKSVRSSSISLKGNKKTAPMEICCMLLIHFYRLYPITLCIKYWRFVFTCAAHLHFHFASRAGNPLNNKDSSEVYKGHEWKNPTIPQVRTTLNYKAVVQLIMFL